MNVIACVPVSEKARHGIPYLDDPASEGYTKTKCEKCGEEVWIGSKSRLVRDLEKMKILCVECAFRMHVKENPGKSIDITSFEELSDNN